MEIEYFIHEKDWKAQFEYWMNQIKEWMHEIGLDTAKIHELEVEGEDLAHYSKRTVDFEFDFPFGRKELYGIAYRTNFDLTNHMQSSGAKLEYFDEDTKEKVIPHVIEPTFGVERTILALLASAYREDEQNGETRAYLSLKPEMAPVVCAVSPLLKNRPELQEKAREIFGMLKKEFGRVMYDDNGNIGKRYRRQDEIGTPWCIVVDFDTLGNGDNVNPDWRDMVTVRDRDTGNQERVKISELVNYIQSKF
jgi:glycyl-tRNA synthetase